MNKELLKVIAGLECCRNPKDVRCDDCPYDDGRITSSRCIGALMTDVLTILREVERDGLY